MLISNNIIDGGGDINARHNNIFTVNCPINQGEIFEPQLSALFKNIQNGDYSPASNSPAIGKGLDISGIILGLSSKYPDYDFSKDIAGIVRHSGAAVDIGAFEYTSIPLGDLSGSGTVTMYDASLALRDLNVGGTCSTLTAQQCTNAQMDGQGNGTTIDGADVVDMAKKAVGL